MRLQNSPGDCLSSWTRPYGRLPFGGIHCIKAPMLCIFHIWFMFFREILMKWTHLSLIYNIYVWITCIFCEINSVYWTNTCYHYIWKYGPVLNDLGECLLGGTHPGWLLLQNSCFVPCNIFQVLVQRKFEHDGSTYITMK